MEVPVEARLRGSGETPLQPASAACGAGPSLGQPWLTQDCVNGSVFNLSPSRTRGGHVALRDPAGRTNRRR